MPKVSVKGLKNVGKSVVAATKKGASKAGNKAVGFARKHPAGVGQTIGATGSLGTAVATGTISGKRRAKKTGEPAKGLKQQWKEGGVGKKAGMVALASPTYVVHTAAKVRASKKVIAAAAKKKKK